MKKKIEKNQDNFKANVDTTAPGRVNELVTIVIKTIVRYPCLYRLVDSIRQFYPEISIIIVDDSPDEAVEVANKDEEYHRIRSDPRITYITPPAEMSKTFEKKVRI